MPAVLALKVMVVDGCGGTSGGGGRRRRRHPCRQNQYQNFKNPLSSMKQLRQYT